MYSNILVAVDLEHQEVGNHLVKLARYLAGESGRVTLLHIVQAVPAYVLAETPPSIVEAHQKDAEARLEAIGRDAARVDETRTVVGQPGTAILDEAERIGADAIVVGSHRPGLSTYLIGSTAARVVRHAQCSVIVDRSQVTA